MTVDWLAALDGPEYRWIDRGCPASEHDIAALARFAGRPVPTDYVAFLHKFDGAILRHGDDWYLRMWHAADISSWSAAYGLTSDKLPGVFASGDNGGPGVYVFDMRPWHPDGRYPVREVDLVCLDWRESLPAAMDFRSFLRRDVPSDHQ